MQIREDFELLECLFVELDPLIVLRPFQKPPELLSNLLAVSLAANQEAE